MTTEKKAASPLLPALPRLALLFVATLFLTASVFFLVVIHKLEAALRRPHTWDAVAAAAGFSADELARQITVESLLAKLPPGIVQLIGDPAILIPATDRQSLNQLLKETVDTSHRDAVAQIPGYLQSADAKLEIAVNLRPIREFILVRIEKKIGVTVSMMFGAALRQGAAQVIPDRLVLDEHTATLKAALAPLKETWPELEQTKTILIICGIVSLFLVALGGGITFRVLYASHVGVSLAGLALLFSSAQTLTQLMSAAIPAVPSTLSTPVAAIIANDIHRPGLAIFVAGFFLLLVTLLLSAVRKRREKNGGKTGG